MAPAPDDKARGAHREQEVELLQLPPPAQMQQVDGTVSSTPSRGTGTGSAQAYEEYDDDPYDDDQPGRGARQP